MRSQSKLALLSKLLPSSLPGDEGTVEMREGTEAENVGDDADGDCGTGKPSRERNVPGKDEINERDCSRGIKLSGGMDGARVETPSSTRTIEGGGEGDAGETLEMEHGTNASDAGTQGSIHGLNYRPGERDKGVSATEEDDPSCWLSSPEVLATVESVSSDKEEETDAKGPAAEQDDEQEGETEGGLALAELCTCAATDSAVW